MDVGRNTSRSIRTLEGTVMEWDAKQSGAFHRSLLSSDVETLLAVVFRRDSWLLFPLRSIVVIYGVERPVAAG